MRRLVLITDRISNPNIETEILGDEFECVYLPELPEPEQEAAISDAYAILVWHSRIDKEIIENLKNCKVVIRYGAGIDNLNIDLLKERGIAVGNCPDYGIEEVADTAAAMILHGMRQLGEFSSVDLDQEQVWGRESRRTLKRSNKHSLGIVGLGRIGTALALRMKEFGLNIGFFDPFAIRGVEKSLKITRFETLEELLHHSSIVSLHCPLTEKTRGMVDEDFVSNLQKNTLLVNTARGGLMSSLQVLEEGLKSGNIGFLAMDVLPEEPPIRDTDILRKWRSVGSGLEGRVLITPHTAYYSEDSLKEIRVKAAKSILNVSLGQDPLYRIV